MVNEGIRCFIETNHGSETWAHICKQAQLDVDQFDRMSSYDDAITYNLVGAICDETGLSAEDVLTVFGTYWVDYAGASPLGNLMRLAGSRFVDIVTGLDDMHDRIRLSMPHLKPPSFELEETGPNTYCLHYISDREGLAPMVIGLLYGLAKRTGEEISVEHAVRRSNGADHDQFHIAVKT